MLYTDKWFERLRKDSESAQEALNDERHAEFHYFTGRIVGGIRVLRDLAETKEQESAERKEG